ncbi:hypothetical protein L9F63_008680, partial [Diploptera punctata]
WLAATQFQPTHARSVFPCFDEPEFKATFNIELTVPNYYHALANTPVEEGYPQAVGDDELVYKFKETGLMSTYLIAFVVSQFDYLKAEGADYSFTAWARKDAIEYAQYSQYIGPELVIWLEEYTGISYTFDKIDQVAIPDFAAGAMENWGLITYRETALLHYNEASTEANRRTVATIVAHELAHMWFGNLVTLKWWEDTWLNEGFATYFEYVATAGVEVEWRLMDQFVVNTLHGALATDSLASAQALSSSCETPAEISGKFTTISYSKGGSILRMTSYILTGRTFSSAIGKYLDEYKEKNTVPQNLFDALETERNTDNIQVPSVNDFLPLWINEPGYPVISVQRNGNSFNIQQERFLLNEDEESSEINWWVPLSWTKESEGLEGFDTTTPMEWLEGVKSTTITIEAEASEWIIFNNQETGYYRVNYDEESWKLIINGLRNNPDNIHVLNRAQLLDDALNLARAGKLSYQIALEVLDYLQNEEDYIPWVSAFSALSFLDRKLVSEDGHADFKEYVRNLISKTYESIGFEVNTEDEHVKHLHRATLLNWACRFEHGDCVQQSKNKFTEYMSVLTLVPANLRNVVYCTALQNGGNEEWEFLWNVYVESDIAVEKNCYTFCSWIGLRPERLLDHLMPPARWALHRDRRYLSPLGVFCSHPKNLELPWVQDKIGLKELVANVQGVLGSLQRFAALVLRYIQDRVLREYKYIKKNECLHGANV